MPAAEGKWRILPNKQFQYSFLLHRFDEQTQHTNEHIDSHSNRDSSYITASSSWHAMTFLWHSGLLTSHILDITVIRSTFVRRQKLKWQKHPVRFTSNEKNANVTCTDTLRTVVRFDFVYSYSVAVNKGHPNCPFQCAILQRCVDFVGATANLMRPLFWQMKKRKWDSSENEPMMRWDIISDQNEK